MSQCLTRNSSVGLFYHNIAFQLLDTIINEDLQYKRNKCFVTNIVTVTGVVHMTWVKVNWDTTPHSLHLSQLQPSLLETWNKPDNYDIPENGHHQNWSCQLKKLYLNSLRKSDFLRKVNKLVRKRTDLVEPHLQNLKEIDWDGGILSISEYSLLERMLRTYQC